MQATVGWQRNQPLVWSQQLLPRGIHIPPDTCGIGCKNPSNNGSLGTHGEHYSKVGSCQGLPSGGQVDKTLCPKTNNKWSWLWILWGIRWLWTTTTSRIPNSLGTFANLQNRLRHSQGGSQMFSWPQRLKCVILPQFPGLLHRKGPASLFHSGSDGHCPRPASSANRDVDLEERSSNSHTWFMNTCAAIARKCLKIGKSIHIRTSVCDPNNVVSEMWTLW